MLLDFCSFDLLKRKYGSKELSKWLKLRGCSCKLHSLAQVSMREKEMEFRYR